MKKITLLLLLCTALANAQLTFTDTWLKNYLLASTSTNNIALNFSLQSVKIDVNSNGEIEASEAALIKRIWIEHPNVTNLGGIQGFTNLTDLDVKLTPVTAVTLAPMPSLQKLQFLECASLTSFNISGMTGLTQVSASENPLMTSVNLAGCVSLTDVIIRNTGLTSLDVSGNTSVANLYLDHNEIATISVAGCTNMNGILLTGNQLTSLNVSGLAQLFAFIVDDNIPLTSINASGCTNLQQVTDQGVISNGNLLTADFSNCSSLQNLTINNTFLQTINVTGCSSLITLDLNGNNLEALNLTGCNSLTMLQCPNNNIQTINFGDATALTQVVAYANEITNAFNFGPSITSLDLALNQISVIDASGLTSLSNLSLAGNPLTNINVSGCSSLSGISFDNVSTPLKNINISNCTSMTQLQFSSPSIETVNIQGCSALTTVSIDGITGSSTMAALDASNLPNLTTLACRNVSLGAIDVSGSPALTIIDLYENNVTEIDLSDNPNIQQLELYRNNLQTIDLSHQVNLQYANLSFNIPLISVFAKNGKAETLDFDSFNENLVFVCQDESGVPATQSELNNNPLITAVCNSYCSFTPGGDYNTITGHIAFDFNGNGCDEGDLPQPNIKVGINDGNTPGATFTDPNGNYSFYTGAGNFDLMGTFENPAYFNVSPLAATLSFPAVDNSTQTQNFCLTANGIHPDVEIVLTPIGPARPGMDAYYQIIYKNKGNQAVSGSLNLLFDDARTDFVSASVAASSQSVNSLSWNYSNLQPFESRMIFLMLNINSPTEIPAVNLDDILDFTASINIPAGDDTPADNVYSVHQTAVNAMDPNAKTCLEGSALSATEIGNYLHYNIEFENLGNADAINVVVKDVIDTTKFDINSLQVLYASHQMRANVSGNVAEFVFPNINLPSAEGNPPVGGHGNVLFKIKTLTTLIAGTQVENKANIYFDYNFPIETDIARTTFQTLGNPGYPVDESIVLYPNPAKDQVNIRCDSPIMTIELFDVQGRMLRNELEVQRTVQLDISNYAKGIYFVRIISEKGMKVVQIIKK
jgi:uncharacterized repeat protein (TIGR01451 family)